MKRSLPGEEEHLDIKSSLSIFMRCIEYELVRKEKIRGSGGIPIIAADTLSEVRLQIFPS